MRFSSACLLMSRSLATIRGVEQRYLRSDGPASCINPDHVERRLRARPHDDPPCNAQHLITDPRDGDRAKLLELTRGLPSGVLRKLVKELSQSLERRPA